MNSKNIKNNLVSIVLAGASFLAGCSHTLEEGEIIKKEYIPEKEGTRILYYPPALLVGSLLLNLATHSPEKYQLTINKYDFKKMEIQEKKLNLKKDIFYLFWEGDWIIHTDKTNPKFKELSNFGNSIKYPIGTKFYENENLHKIPYNNN